MDYEVKKFLLKYFDGIDEDIYLNFIKQFAKRPVSLIKRGEMSVYLKCKQFARCKKTDNKQFAQ